MVLYILIFLSSLVSNQALKSLRVQAAAAIGAKGLRPLPTTSDHGASSVISCSESQRHAVSPQLSLAVGRIANYRGRAVLANTSSPAAQVANFLPMYN